MQLQWRLGPWACNWGTWFAGSEYLCDFEDREIFSRLWSPILCPWPLSLGEQLRIALGLTFTIKHVWSPLGGYPLWLALTWIPFGLSYLFLENLLLSVEEVSAYNKIELGSKLVSVSLIALVLGFGLATPETVFATGLTVVTMGSVWILFLIRSTALGPHFHHRHYSQGISDIACGDISLRCLLLSGYVLTCS